MKVAGEPTKLIVIILIFLQLRYKGSPIDTLLTQIKDVNFLICSFLTSAERLLKSEHITCYLSGFYCILNRTTISRSVQIYTCLGLPILPDINSRNLVLCEYETLKYMLFNITYVVFLDLKRLFQSLAFFCAHNNTSIQVFVLTIIQCLDVRQDWILFFSTCVNDFRM